MTLCRCLSLVLNPTTLHWILLQQLYGIFVMKIISKQITRLLPTFRRTSQSMETHAMPPQIRLGSHLQGQAPGLLAAIHHRLLCLLQLSLLPTRQRNILRSSTPAEQNIFHLFTSHLLPLLSKFGKKDPFYGFALWQNLRIPSHNNWHLGAK